MMARSRENFSVNWTGAALRTSIPRQIRRSTTGGLTLGLLREKAIAVMEELDDINVPREKLWAQAMLFACDVTNKSAATSTAGGKSPYKLWFEKEPLFLIICDRLE